MSDVETAAVLTSDLGRQIAEGIAKGIAASGPRPKVSFGQYMSRQPKKPKLTRDCAQNGYQMRPESLTVEAITLLNAITHSGRYIDRRVEVIVRDEGSSETVDLRYPNKTTDMRTENAHHWRTLEDMLQQIVTAQEAERAEDAVASPTMPVVRRLPKRR